MKRQLNILLVETNHKEYEKINNLLAQIEDTQINLDWVDSYQLALRRITHFKHHIYFITQCLDDQDQSGLKLLTEAIKAGCNAPIIILIDKDNYQDGLKAIRAGAADCLIKSRLDSQRLARSIYYTIERKRVEDELRQSNIRLQTAIENSPVIVFNQDKDLRYTWVHNLPADFWGGDIAGKTDADLLPPEDAAHLTRIKRRILETGEQTREEVKITINGETFYYDLTLEPLRNSAGNIVGISCTTWDITERKRAEEALRQTHNQLEKRVIERTAELEKINARLKEEIAERQRLEQHVNESLQRRTLQVQTSTEIAQEIATSPRPGELFRQVVNLVQKQFGYYHAHVYTLEGDYLVMREGTGEAGLKLKQAGHKIPLMAEKSLVAHAARSGQPVLVSDVYREPSWLPNPFLPETKSEIAVPIMLRDKVLGVLDVQNDMIDSLGQEDQILLMGLCGQIAVAIHNRQLETQRRTAEEAQAKLIEDLDAFAHTVGYNLREPLALVIGYTELLKEQARLPEELQEYLNSIARNGHKLSNIIDELQLLTGVRKAEVHLMPLNMARVVAEVQQRLAYLIQEYQAKIIVSEYWPVALGHKPWVEEVWSNYISNAIRYGGQPPRVQVGATLQSDGMVRFWVKDNGPGLSKEEQAQLFKEFTHLNQVQVKGYGLGLSIVRRIITKLGGQVRVESEGIPGKGSIFSFTLPQALSIDGN